MAEKHVFGVKGSYEKRSSEEQRDLSLKVMEKKFGSCSSKYNVLYFPVPRRFPLLLLFQPPQ